MGVKNPDGSFVIPVQPPLTPGHFIYASDGCTDAPFNVGQDVIVQPMAAAPTLAPRLLAVLVATLGLVGVFGLRRKVRAD
jgi:hypothetical protein